MPFIDASAESKRPTAEFSLTVSRALSILSMFSASRTELSLAEICRHTRLSKTSVLRLLQALNLHGYVMLDPRTRHYVPGYEVFRIGSLVGQWGIRPIALGVMQKLTDETGFTTIVSVPQGRHIVVLASVEGKTNLRYVVPNGDQLTLHGTAAGQAALSTYPDAKVTEMLRDETFSNCRPSAPSNIEELVERLHHIRHQGYALSWEMVSPGVGSVSSPVIGVNGELAAVLTLGFGTGQVAREECDHLGKRIQRAASELTAALNASVGAQNPPRS